MTAGARIHPIIVQRQGAGKDGFGGKNAAWATYAEALARIFFGKGSEVREAAQQGSSYAATFIVLDTTLTRQVKPTDRIQFDGAVWDISANIPSRRFHREREITATRQRE